MTNQFPDLGGKSCALLIMLLGSAALVDAQIPPTISSQPTSQTNLEGSSITFSVAVDGTGPFTYQWQFNGTNLANHTITTVAGNGSAAYTGNGNAATNAGINSPKGVFCDADGNLFIADSGNNRIRKVDTNGVITTVAGDGSAAYTGDGGMATNASINSPNGVICDANGNLFFADSGNNRIRKVDTNGVITTVAGDGTAAYTGDGGMATNASINSPTGVAFDAAGSLYFGADYNNCVRKVGTNGIINTVAGGGNPSGDYQGGPYASNNAALYSPDGMAFDVDGNLYIADTANNRIRKVDTNNRITTVAGIGNGNVATGDGGPATNASINFPTGIAFDAVGNLYIAADYNNNDIRKVNTNGIITTVAGAGNGTYGGGAYGGDGGPATNASLNAPGGLTFDAVGNLFIADTANNRVREVHFAGFPALTLTDISNANAGNYTVVITSPYGSVTSAVATLVVLLPPSILVQPTSQGIIPGSNATLNVTATGTMPLNYSWYFNATNLVQSSTNASLLVTNFGLANVGQYFVVVTNAYGSVTSDVARLELPPGMSVTTQPASQTNLEGSSVTFGVVVDGLGPFSYQWRFNGTNLANNIITTVAGNGSYSFPGEGDGGPATNASLYHPPGVALDSAGNLFIADGGYNRIRKVNTNGIINTVAGNGNGDYSGDGVAATNTTLSHPNGVCLDSAGSIYIADSSNERVRKVDTSGVIHTLVGNTDQGYFGSYSGDGGPATNATVNYPFGVFCDLSGNLFIADSGNNRVRKIDTNGIINTVAGNGTAAYAGDGGVATNAALSSPLGVFVDALGDFYIADSGNNRIRKVDTNGIITTVAGGGSGGDGGLATNATLNPPLASVNSPLEVTLDGAGNMYIGDGNYHSVRKVDTNGIITTVAGNGNAGYAGDGGAATNANLNGPYGVALDALGNLYIADTGNSRVREVHFAGFPSLTLTNIDASDIGNYTVVIANAYGSVTSAVATLTVLLRPAILSQPTIQGNSNVTLSVIATGTEPLNYLWYFNSTNLVQSSTNASLTASNVSAANVGQYFVVVTNDYGSVTSRVVYLSYPSSLITGPVSQIVFAGSNVTLDVTASGFQPLVYQWQLNGTNLPNNIITTVAGGGPSRPGDGGPATNASLSRVSGIVSDNRGNFYIADYGFSRVHKVDTNGIITTVAGNGTNRYSGDGGLATNASLYSPFGVAVDAMGDIYISEYSDSRVRKVDTNGFITTVAGIGTAGYSGDNGAATNASLNYPNGIAVDSGGNLYIADYYNNRVRRVDTNGIITTVAGNGVYAFSGDGGPATNASLRYPAGVMVDDWGSLYIADSYNLRIRRVDTNGIITTVAGSNNAAFSGDGGAATNAGINQPTGVAFDTIGNMYIADRGHGRIRQVDLNSIITTVAGNGGVTFSGDGGAATNASLNSPTGVALAPSGVLWIADQQNNRVRQVTLGRLSGLRFGSVKTNNAGSYQVVVSNPYGNGCITSSIVSLTVVSLQLSNRTVILGSNVTFAVSAAGPVPVSYQWQFNASDIDGATNASLTLTNVQLANQGAYDVIAGDVSGSIVSPTASLIVTGSAPSAVMIQPTNQAVFAGSNCTFTATANGTPPLSYQWQVNGTNIDSATNAVLTLTNVQLTDQGSYRVVVTNYFGSATSTNAILVVLDLGTSLDAPGLAWTTGGTAPWFPETSVTHDGVEAAQSGAVGPGQQSILQTTVVGPGKLTFWWQISSQGSASFAVNGIPQASIIFFTFWQQKTFYLGTGTQALSWTYTGGSAPFGSNAAWLDQVNYVPGGTAPTLTIVPTNQTAFTASTVIFNSLAVGTPRLSYQWTFNGVAIDNATNAQLRLVNVQGAASGIYSVAVTNDYGAVGTNANLVVQPFGLSTFPTNLLMTTNGFQLQVDGVFATNSLVVYASTNLVDWLSIFTNPPATGSLRFLNSNALSRPVQFYRAVEQ